MIAKNDPIDGLYSLSKESSTDAQISRRDRNRFLIGFVAIGSITGAAKVFGANMPLVVFAFEAGVTLLPAGACEISRRISLSTSRDFREGARECVELDIITNDTTWEQTLEEPRNTEPPPAD